MSSQSLKEPGLLERIVLTKQKEVELIPDDIRNQNCRPSSRSFYEALKRSPGAPIRVISECKKASPSMGLIKPDYDPGEIAQTYASLGASAISVLTDQEYFQGAHYHILMAAASGKPILRKDFIIDEKQILEARLLGANAILLIVRLLDLRRLVDFQKLAHSLKMDVLVEIHNENELNLALEAEARIIGINHRNLDTLEMDLSLTEQLAPRIRKDFPDTLIIAESGVESPQGRARVDQFADAILIGTALMKSPDIPSKWREIFG